MTNNIYSVKSPVNVNTVGFDGKMNIADAMAVFQYAVTLHTEELGVGYQSVLKNHGAKWVISKIRFEVERFPENGEIIETSTWPLRPGHLRFGRCFSIKDESGADCVTARSNWCIIDKDSSQVMDTSVLKIPISEYLTECRTGNYSKFSMELTEDDLCYKRKMRLCDLDLNGHVNNIAYLRMALDCFSSREMKELEIKSFEMVYRKQCFEGETISLYRGNDKDGFYIEAKTEDGDIVFTAAINK